ncbi:MAG TPA: carboxymuconolactone decarboxylase family protein [Stellaceae bacterium]|jgi:4-carboxymuconolactone decarboxylase|nr:carboxymuconolactone decarboxylase family protein [Stellaceae bacterium]
MSGARFKPLAASAMTPAQARVADAILAGPRKNLRGPFVPLLRSPELADRVQQLGLYFRFETKLPKNLKEVAILVTARHWGAQYEWYAHRKFALEAGLAPAMCDAIARGERPQAMSADEALVHDYASELLKTKGVSDDLFARALQRFGEEGVIDLTVCIGYYGMIGLTLNADRTPLPEGETPLPKLKD